MRQWPVALVSLSLLLLAPPLMAADAFVGAVGHGADSIGGRGGIVMFVTNLDGTSGTKYCTPAAPGASFGGTQAAGWLDAQTCSGTSCNGVANSCVNATPGSAKMAILTTVPRHVVPLVSGEVDWASKIVIEGSEYDNLTWFGQASYGDGIRFVEQIRFEGIHDHIWRYFDMCPACASDGPYVYGNKCSSHQGFFLVGNGVGMRFSEDWIVDHATVWGTGDATFSAWRGSRNVTIQNSFVGAPIYAIGECCPGGDCSTQFTGESPRESCSPSDACTLEGGESCDYRWASCDGTNLSFAGDPGQPWASVLSESYNFTAYRNAMSHSEARNPRVAGMFDTAENSVACSGGTCSGGERSGQSCASSRQCPASVPGTGTADLVNNFGTSGNEYNSHSAPTIFSHAIEVASVNSYGGFAMVNIVSNFYRRIVDEQGRGQSPITTLDTWSDVHVEDFIYEFENPRAKEDGVVCHPGTFDDGPDCDNDGQCSAGDCDMTEVCPASNPCEACSDTRSNYTSYKACWQQPTLADDGLIGGSLTNLSAGEIASAVNVPDLVVSPTTICESGTNNGTVCLDDTYCTGGGTCTGTRAGTRDTGDNWPDEGTILAVMLDEAWSGDAHPYHCSQICSDSTASGGYEQPFTRGRRHNGITFWYNNCPTVCNSNINDDFGGAYGYNVDDKYDGTCASGGADCRCDSLPTSATCTSTAHCGGGTCNVGIGDADFWDDDDWDGIEDSWETTYCSGGECAVGDGIAACSEGGTWSAINGDPVSHYECIEVFMGERVGEFVFNADDPGAAVYYVDCDSGNDGNAGTSTAAPWLTKTKVNSTVTTTGSDVYFLRGTTCSTNVTLTVDWDGTSGDPAIIGAYGAGALPILETNGNDGVIASGRSYVEIRDLDIRLADITNQGIRVSDAASDHITIDGCTIDGGNNSIFINQTETFTINDNNLSRCTNNCIAIWGKANLPETSQARNGTISNNNIQCQHPPGGNDGIVLHPDGSGDGASPGNNMLIEGNTVSGCVENAIDLNNIFEPFVPTNWTVRGNTTSSSGEIGMLISGINGLIVERNHFFDEGDEDDIIRIQGTTNSNYIFRNNIFEVDPDGDEHVFRAQTGTSGSTWSFVNNTIYAATIFTMPWDITATVTGVTISNNIVHAASTINKILAIRDGTAETMSLTMQGNYFYTPVQGWTSSSGNSVSDNGTNRTWDGFVAAHSGLTLEATWADPQLVNPPVDWTLTAGSPCINDGNNGVCPSDDYTGASRTDGQCDVGAFEYLAISPPNIERGVAIGLGTEVQ